MSGRGEWLVAGVALGLMGCATGPRLDKAPVPPKVVTVDRVVSETCLRVGDIPTLPGAVGASLDGEAQHDAAVLAAAVLADRAWQGEALALLRGCAGEAAAR